MKNKILRQDRIKQLEKQNEVLKDLLSLQKYIIEFVLKCERFEIDYDISYDISF